MADRDNVFRIAIEPTRAVFGTPNGALKKVTCAAIRRRFADSANTGHVFKTKAESWVAGDDAAALAHFCGTDAQSNELDLDVRALTAMPHWGRISPDPVDRWRFLIAILADIRRQIAAELETASNIRTIFALPPELAGWSTPTPGTSTDWAATPPFWLVYAIRRFNWPGTLHFSVLDAPTEHLEKLSPSDAGEFSRQPALQYHAGCWEHDDAEEAQKGIQPLTVMLEAPTRQASMMAPQRAALPLIEHFQFQDPAAGSVSDPSVGSTEQRLRLFRRVRTGADNQTLLIVTRGDGPADSDEIGHVDLMDAPVNPSAIYTLRAELDVWGRLRVALFDAQNAPLPILQLNTQQDGRKDTYIRTHLLAVDSLLFPNETDSELLMRVPSTVNSESEATDFQDVVELLDLTGFDGFAASQRAANLTAERFHINPQKFWDRESVWLAQELGTADLEKLEIASAALFVEVDPTQPETLSSNFEPAQDADLKIFVEQGKLLPHFQPLDEMPPSSGAATVPVSQKPPLTRFFEALPRLQNNPASPLAAEVAKWMSQATRQGRGD